MQRLIAIANQKGGTSKTTTAVNVAAALVRCQQRVLLVDLDPQGNASTYLGHRSDGRGLLEALGFLNSGDGSRPLIELVQTTVCGVDLIASGPLMAGAEKLLAAEVGGEFVLRSALATLPADRWDCVIMDCPPSLGMLSVSALAAAREVLVPVHTEAMPLDGVANLMQTFELVRTRINPALTVLGFVSSRTDTTRLSRSVEAALRERFGDRVFTSTVRKNIKIAESYSHGQPITDYAPESTGAADYEAVALELVRRVAA